MEFLTEGNGVYLVMAILTGLIGGIGVVVYRSPTKRPFWGNIMVPCVFIGLALLFYLLTLSFPDEEAGPAVIPHLWSLVLLTLSVYLLIQAVRGSMPPDPKNGRLDILALFIGSIIGYLIVMQILGYYIATFIFLVGVMYFLAYRKYIMILAVTGGWLLFAYFVFQRMLYIPLPQGKLIEMIMY